MNDRINYLQFLRDSEINPYTRKRIKHDSKTFQNIVDTFKHKMSNNNLPFNFLSKNKQTDINNLHHSLFLSYGFSLNDSYNICLLVPILHTYLNTIKDSEKYVYEVIFTSESFITLFDEKLSLILFFYSKLNLCLNNFLIEITLILSLIYKDSNKNINIQYNIDVLPDELRAFIHKNICYLNTPSNSYIKSSKDDIEASYVSVAMAGDGDDFILINIHDNEKLATSFFDAIYYYIYQFKTYFK